ncbi:WYL domain-containing protein [Sphingomonas sp. IW22]|uniref:WYL domain-containing protein n=1 Tax=Sphingomonas sp. IW22 TaxID=3242489 RepID=UPI0035214E07
MFKASDIRDRRISVGSDTTPVRETVHSIKRNGHSKRRIDRSSKNPGRKDQPIYLRLDRMIAVTVSETIGCAQDDWNIDAWLVDSFAVWRDEKQDVVLRVLSSDAGRARHCRFYGKQRTDNLAGGGLRIRFATGGMRELAEHLFT